MSWPSAKRARQLSTAAARYRSSFDIDAIDEGLSLLALGTKALKKHKPKHVRGPMTWAKIAEGVANAVGEALVNATDRDEVKEAAARAAKLDKRLRQRDASRDGRVTKQTRELIQLVCNAAASLLHLVLLIQNHSDDSLARTSLDDGGKALSMYSRMVKLHERYGGSIVFSRRLLERAVGLVLASNAHEGVKSLYFKALERWPAAPSAFVDGTSVQWDDF